MDVDLIPRNYTIICLSEHEGNSSMTMSIDLRYNNVVYKIIT